MILYFLLVGVWILLWLLFWALGCPGGYSVYTLVLISFFNEI